MAEYTREDFEKIIDIPVSVEYEIKEIIDNKLKKCGIFSRIFSRRKSSESIEHKLHKDEYKDGRKIQDIIGIRIILYFEDDIAICQKIIREWFRPVGDWEVYDNDISEFRASKINGIFELEGDWVRRISPQTWLFPIDQTFEIQLRTTFFEGWHEVEHDMRYKNKAIWDEYPAFSRKLNSVVATLELCDSSMVSICEDFAHQLYLDKKWEAMVNMHYRLRMNDEPINPELKRILDDNSKTLGKRLYRCRRHELIRMLLDDRHRTGAISVNRIIVMANEADKEMQNEEIRAIAEKNGFFRGEKKGDAGRTYQYAINPLEEYPNFRNKLTIECNEKDKKKIFEELSMIIYSWARDKFKAIFRLPEDRITECDEKIPGYWLKVSKNDNFLSMDMHTYHLSTNEVGRMWNVQASIRWDPILRLFWFETKNAVLSTEPVDIESRMPNYNPPRFYSEIVKCDDIEVLDVRKYTCKCSPVYDNEVDLMIDLIRSNERQTPVVLIASKIGADGFLDESWLSRYWCSDLAQRAGLYSHIYRCGEENLNKILDGLGLKRDAFPGLYIFYSNTFDKDGKPRQGGYNSYPESYVAECVYNQVRVSSSGFNVDTKQGDRAFLHEIVDMIRRDNIIRQL